MVILNDKTQCIEYVNSEGKDIAGMTYELFYNIFDQMPNSYVYNELDEDKWRFLMGWPEMHITAYGAISAYFMRRDK